MLGYSDTPGEADRSGKREIRGSDQTCYESIGEYVGRASKSVISCHLLFFPYCYDNLL